MGYERTRGAWRAWIIIMMVGAAMTWRTSPMSAAPPTNDPLHRLAVQLAEGDESSTSAVTARASALSPMVAIDDEAESSPAEASGRIEIAEEPVAASADGLQAADDTVAPLRRSLGQWSSALDGESKSQPFAPAAGNSSSGGWALQTIAALGLVIALALALRWAWVKLTGHVPARASSPVLEVLSRTTIAPRNQVVLLRLGGRILVVGDSPAGLRTLANVDDPEEVASLLTAITAAQPTSMSQGFSQLMHRFNNEYERPEEELDGRDAEGPRLDRARYSVSGLLSRLRHVGVTR